MRGGRVLVTGATGRLGRALLAALGCRGVAGVRHQGDAPRAILIGTDGTVDPVSLRGIGAIVNCAGRVDGSQAEVEQANVTYPTALARAARTAGVARFVQVSSFSVFGRTERIEADSPLAPVDAYGRSKVAAEQELTALNVPGFRTLTLRLPFMFSADHPAHLGRLVAVMRRLRVLPTPSGQPSRRSMITYAGAADTLIALADAASPPAGPVAAADPAPLPLLTIARAIEAILEQRITVLPVPRPAAVLLTFVAPGVASRLFQSSVLDDRVNLLQSSGSHSVEAEMHAYLRKLRAGRSAGHNGQT